MRQIFYPHWDEWFTSKIKGFMVWYGVLFILLVLLSLYVSVSAVPPPLYLLLFSSLLATGVLLFIPLKWFGYLAPLSIPIYLLFIHIFLFYTGGAESPYYLMYLMPLILASILFRYAGTIVIFLLILVSHLVLESVPIIIPIIPYLSSEHFLARDLPVFVIIFLVAVMLSVVASMMEEERETIRHLLGQLKREFEITKTLHNTDMAILSTVDKQEILQLCITNFRALVDADYVSIAALDSERNEFKLEASSFFDLFNVDKRVIPFDSTILKWVVSSKISRYCPDKRRRPA